MRRQPPGASPLPPFPFPERERVGARARRRRARRQSPAFGACERASSPSPTSSTSPSSTRDARPRRRHPLLLLLLLRRARASSTIQRPPHRRLAASCISGAWDAGMGGMDTQLVSPAVAGVMSEMSILGNWLSILIDIGPLFVVLCSYDWKEVSKFFSLKSFILSAVMNFLLVSHVLFVIDEKEKHRDVLFVSVVGFCTATLYAFFLLAHRVVMKNSRSARYLMILILLCFVFGCLALLSGIFAEYQSKGTIIKVAGFLVVFLLNAATVYPAVTCKPIPDDEATFYTVCMSVMNSIDAVFLCITPIVSSMNAVGALLQLLALSVAAILKELLKGLRKVQNWCRSCAASCRDFLRHHRNE